MDTSGSRAMDAVWSEEPEEFDPNTAAIETRLQDDGAKRAEAVLDGWDQEKWAENVTRQ